MYKRTFAVLTVLVLSYGVAWGQGTTSTPILAGPLAKLDIKDAKNDLSETPVDAIRHFSDPDLCLDFLIAIR